MHKLKKLSDLEFTNTVIKRVVPIFVPVKTTPLQNPKLLHFNESLSTVLNLDPNEFQKESMLNFLNGNLEFDGVHYLASFYSGHQFGHFVPRLGDGRAILLGEVKNEEGEFFEWQLKGAGLTPHSRMGDGKAVVRSSIREYLASAHLKALGIPTTEALSIVSGSDKVYREEVENAAIVLRVAPSFLRFGHFEFLYYHGEHEILKELIEFVIDHYFIEFKDHPNRYHLFYQEVCKRTAKLIAHWQSVGFCHGVMNTDNMSILGLTIDYGPYGFLDNLDLDHICNHSDDSGRYSFGNQPPIAKWNLEKLGIALSPFVSEESRKLILGTFEPTFNFEYQRLLRLKLGLRTIKEADDQFFKLCLNMLVASKIDYTQFFRDLSSYGIGERPSTPIPSLLIEFLDEYDKRLKSENSIDFDRQSEMKKNNPKFILRNYLAQMTIEDHSLLPKMFDVLTNPFNEWNEVEEWSKTAPEKYQFICVSCSS